MQLSVRAQTAAEDRVKRSMKFPFHRDERDDNTECALCGWLSRSGTWRARAIIGVIEFEESTWKT